MSDDIPDGHSTSSSSTGSNSHTMTGEEPGRNRPQRHSQLPARFREDINNADGVLCEVCHSTEPEVWHPALCSGSTVTSVVCGCTTIVSSRKMMSVANMCAVIVQQIAIELLFL